MTVARSSADNHGHDLTTSSRSSIAAGSRWILRCGVSICSIFRRILEMFDSPREVVKLANEFDAKDAAVMSLGVALMECGNIVPQFV